MKSLIPWRRNDRHAAPALWRDNWFDRMWDDPFDGWFSHALKSSSTKAFSVDVSEDKNEVTVRAETPGMTEKDIDLTWHDGVLRIRGEKKEEREETKKGRYYSECQYGSFTRDIPLGGSVDWSRAQAKYKHGVLTVKLPKTEQTNKRIDIKIN